MYFTARPAPKQVRRRAPVRDVQVAGRVRCARRRPMRRRLRVRQEVQRCAATRRLRWPAAAPGTPRRRPPSSPGGCSARSPDRSTPGVRFSPGDAEHLDRHAADVPLAVGAGRGVREADRAPDRCAACANSPTRSSAGRSVEHGELGLHAAGRARLVEAPPARPARWPLRARLLEERDELGDDRRFVGARSSPPPAPVMRASTDAAADRRTAAGRRPT